MGLQSVRHQLTRMAIALGPGNVLVRSLLRAACRRYKARLGFSEAGIDICKGHRAIRIATQHFVYAIDMARSFEQYFAQVVPTQANGILVADYSYPHLQRYAKSNLEFELASFPEEEEAIESYFLWYQPSPGDVVFDFGAYCGVSAYHLSRRVGLTGKVYAFEPDEVNYRLLQKNIERHQLRNVVALQMAVSGSSGNASFCNEGTLGSCLTRQMSRATVGTIGTVPTISLQDACDRYGVPSFIKMDIEGSEIEVLRAARSFLARHSIQFVLDTNHWVNGVRTNRAAEALFLDCGYFSESSEKYGFMTTWARKGDGHDEKAADVNTVQGAAIQQRTCPVCGGSSSELLFRQSFQTLETVSLLQGYDLVVCQRCGMTFASGIPDQRAFDQYYRDVSKYAYEHRGGKESEEDDWRLGQVANALQRFLGDRNVRILEVGSASGRLLKYLKDEGYEHAFGLDPSPACSEAARNLYGVTVFTGSVFDPPQSDRPYDFVVLLGVLEHIRDVDAAVRGLRRLLSSAGQIYVEVPDATNFIPEQDAPFQEFSTEHINFFSPVALRYLMEAAGFRTVECKSDLRQDRTGRPFPLVYGVFERSNQSRAEFPRHPEAEAGLLRYIDKCRGMDAELRLRIDRAVSGGSGVIVWGVGTHTQRLLATGALNTANIVAFVDSNPKYQNQRLRGIPVVGPDALKNRPEPILISSYAFQQEIADQIHAMRLPNELILLHAADSAVGVESN